MIAKYQYKTYLINKDFNRIYTDEKIKLNKGWIDLDDDGIQETYDISVGGEYPEGSEWGTNGGSVWFGFTSTDGSIQIGEYSSRLDFKVSDDIMNRIAALEQEIENLKNN